MIPAFTQSGVLPPFDPARGPARLGSMSPYSVSASAFVGHFVTSAERADLLRGFLNYRSELRAIGIVDGFQWVNGSFLEDVENTEGRAPRDIDLVTFFRPPAGMSPADWRQLVFRNQHLFHPIKAKAAFHCDAYAQDLRVPAEFLVKVSRYWFGLFSHKRNGIWKGMLEISLQSDDAAAALLL